jgi:hypothetical protein
LQEKTKSRTASKLDEIAVSRTLDPKLGHDRHILTFLSEFVLPARDPVVQLQALFVLIIKIVASATLRRKDMRDCGEARQFTKIIQMV